LGREKARDRILGCCGLNSPGRREGSNGFDQRPVNDANASHRMNRRRGGSLSPARLDSVRPLDFKENTMRLPRVPSLLKLGAASGIAVLAISPSAHAGDKAYLERLGNVTTLASTVPGNGDVNPYGIAVVERSTGWLRRGDVLVSNFNNAANLQGTGSTIVQVRPSGATRLFAQIDASGPARHCTGGIGLTTALVVLQRGWVIVGSLPSRTGQAADAAAGCLIVLDAEGKVVDAWVGDGIAGPWDMTADDDGDEASLFVSNVLNGDVTAGAPHRVNAGTVIRIDLQVPYPGAGTPQRAATTVIGSGFGQTADPAALVIGPTGLALGWDGTLYVADTLDNRIAAIADAGARRSSAGTGVTVAQGGNLNSPLGLATAPNGDLLSANAGDGNLVETTPEGIQSAVRTVDSATGAGSLFGLAPSVRGRTLYFVDDGDNTLKAMAR
jgi:sugar lactone lactonase YvrE